MITIRVLNHKGEAYSSNFIQIVESPTFNCQTACIGEFYILLQTLDRLAMLQQPKEAPKDQAIKLFNKIRDFMANDHKVEKILFIVDIRSQYLNSMEKYFTVRSKCAYFSTNGSEMILAVIEIPFN